MDIFKQWLEQIAHEIEEVGRLEQKAQRILQGRCTECGRKLPDNSPSYQCEPECLSHVADSYKEES